MAETGDADSQFRIGQMYGNGFGVTKDDTLTAKRQSLAADQGHTRARYNLGIVHLISRRVPQGDEEAVGLFTARSGAGRRPCNGHLEDAGRSAGAFAARFRATDSQSPSALQVSLFGEFNGVFLLISLFRAVHHLSAPCRLVIHCRHYRHRER
ncbi:MAG: hypothetical protein RIA65_11740 [Woeseia sp.]